jgi:2-amino-4-hydroxy-6-hydroxymethyldihydropteridine diphosphokinase
MGDSIAYLDAARNLIAQKVGLILNSSSLYKTEPWAMCADQWFFNQVLEVQCLSDADQLLETLLGIELELGRSRPQEKSDAYSSRTIDIDILYFDDITFDNEILTIPHPRIQERKFVLEPLCEIAPSLIHPLIGLSQKAMLDICTDQSSIQRI